MNQAERRQYLIRELLREQPSYANMEVPAQESQQKSLLRGLMNVRQPAPISPDFERIQDEYLQEELRARGITQASSLAPVQPGIYLWRGDITLLACDAIVNAANSGMTGCYQPEHFCIDNCIHTFAGIQLRNYCAQLMQQQGHQEPTGSAKITPAFNLPSSYVIHTVGPIAYGSPSTDDCKQLASSYWSCLQLASKNHLHNLAFCCISTGVFGFPQYEAACIAVDTVRTYRQNIDSSLEVIFNVFSEEDEAIYQQLLTNPRR